MVASRRSRGNYAQTTEQKQIKRDIMLRLYASGERTTSLELRKKFSETMKRSWKLGKITAENHWSMTPEGRERISARVKGKKLGPQPKMSLAAQRRLRTKRETLYTSARGGFRDDLNCYFRSCWEANFARILNLQGRSWSYEHRTFQLAESMSYTPDFYVHDENVYYELKGRMDEKSMTQLQLMKVVHPDIKLEVIDGAKYQALRVQFKDQVAWEGK